MKTPYTSLLLSAICTALLCLAPNRSAAANLVINGDFETGTFTGWTVTNAASGSNIAVRAIPPAHDTLGAAFGATGASSDSISQVLATTPGAFYDLSFFYEVGFANGLLANNKIEIFFNGMSVGSPTFPQSNVNPGFGTFTITNLLATSALTTLEFQGRNALSAQATSGTAYDYIDDVTVTASVPEPGTNALLLMIGVLALVGFKRIRVARGRAA